MAAVTTVSTVAASADGSDIKLRTNKQSSDSTVTDNFKLLQSCNFGCDVTITNDTNHVFELNGVMPTDGTLLGTKPKCHIRNCEESILSLRRLSLNKRRGSAATDTDVILVEYSISDGAQEEIAYLLVGHGQLKESIASFGIVHLLSDSSVLGSNAGKSATEIFDELTSHSVSVSYVPGFEHFSIAIEFDQLDSRKLQIVASCTCIGCSPPVGNVPRMPLCYLSRGGVENHLEKTVMELADSQRLVLWGVPGSGKTTLAAQVARNPRIMRKFGQIFWFEMDNNIGISKNLISLASLIDAQVNSLSDVLGLGFAIYTKFASTELRDCLLIVDNLLSEDVAQLFQFGVRTILISQTNFASDAMGDSSYKLAEAFTEDEVVEYFAQYIDEFEQRFGNTPACGRLLFNLSKGNPLILKCLLVNLSRKMKSSTSTATAEDILLTMDFNDETTMVYSSSEINYGSDNVFTLQDIAKTMDFEHFPANTTESDTATCDDASTLHFACQTGDTNLVAHFLSNGADISTTNDEKLTSLHIGVAGGHTEVVKMILEHAEATGDKASLSKCVNNAQTKCGKTALHLATLANHSAGCEMVQLLLNAAADISIIDDGKRTCLHTALLEGRTDAATLLLGKGADVAALTIENYSCLHIAVLNQNAVMVTRVLKSVDGRSDLNCTEFVNWRTTAGDTALNLASQTGNFDIVRTLLDRGACMAAANDENYNSLHSAALHGHTQVLEELIQSANGNNGLMFTNLINTRIHDQGTVLHLAAQQGNADVVALLLQHGADICAKDCEQRTCLHVAALHGFTDVVQDLLRAAESTPNLEYSGFINARTLDGDTCLLLACRRGHSDVAMLLLSNGADFTLGVEDGSNLTCLHVSAQKGMTTVVNDLLERAGKLGDSHFSKFVNAQTTQGQRTALHLASCYGQAEISAQLLKCGANFGIVDANSWNSLHHASYHGHASVLNILLDFANENQLVSDFDKLLNAQVDDGRTALYLASQNNHNDIVDLLLKMEADITLSTKDNYTCFHIAALNGHARLLEQLLKYAEHVNRDDLVNATTNDGKTALQLAVQNDHADIVCLLWPKDDGDATEAAGSESMTSALESDEGKKSTVDRENFGERTNHSKVILWAETQSHKQKLARRHS